VPACARFIIAFPGYQRSREGVVLAQRPSFGPSVVHTEGRFLSLVCWYELSLVDDTRRELHLGRVQVQQLHLLPPSWIEPWSNLNPPATSA
jgi:hypothetical protein